MRCKLLLVDPARVIPHSRYLIRPIWKTGGSPHRRGEAAAAMHSVRRVRRSEEQIKARKQKEAGEIQRYNALNDWVLARNPDVAPLQALARNSQLLNLNPEHYTAWNIRREILEQIEPEETQKEYIIADLKFLESLLPTHPKVYWIWNHRRWVLERCEGMWEREMALVNKLLERDPRNFHGWTYRRWVLASNSAQESSKRRQAELDYTTKKINENFSNFSAWHNRAQLLSQIDPEQRPTLRHELDYAGQAIAMDPQDQSAWLYYDWLLTGTLYAESRTADIIEGEYEVVKELYEEEDSIWCVQTFWKLTQLSGKPGDHSNIVKRMIELDPLRRRRYESLLES